jgi:transcriptional regulator with XRE-family HTH domain
MTPAPFKTKRKLAISLGEALRAARQEASLTQADVAERAGMSTEVYGRLERGHMLPSLPRLRRLCQVLRMDANVALKLTGRDAAAWLSDAPPRPSDDPPPLRRLVRTLRQLDPEQLAALSVMANTLAKLSGRHLPSREEEEPSPDPLTA